MQPSRSWFGRVQFKDWQDYATLELNLQESLAQNRGFQRGSSGSFRKEEDLNLQENKKYLHHSLKFDIILLSNVLILKVF